MTVHVMSVACNITDSATGRVMSKMKYSVCLFILEICAHLCQDGKLIRLAVQLFLCVTAGMHGFFHFARHWFKKKNKSFYNKKKSLLFSGSSRKITCNLKSFYSFEIEAQKISFRDSSC